MLNPGGVIWDPACAFFLTPSLHRLPLLFSVLLFCYLVLQLGSSSPQAPSTLHFSLCFPEPWEVNDMPTRCHWRTSPPPSSPLTANTSSTASCLINLLQIVQLKLSLFLVSVWLLEHPHTATITPPLLFFLFLTRHHAVLTFYSQAIRSYLECVTRAILHHLTDQELPRKADPRMIRWRFGKRREWGL